MPAVNSGSNIPVVQFSSGNARALQQFSRTLFGLSSQFEDQLDQTAEAEAAKQGAIAGLAGNTEEQSYETIRGRAYNRAMLETFVTTMDTQAMVGIKRLSQQYRNDPVALERATNDFLSGMASELDKVAPGSGAAFRGRQTARVIPEVETARNVRFTLTRQEADAALILHEASIMEQVRKNSVALLSDNPNQSAAASAAVAQSTGEYLRTFDAIDPVTNMPLYTPEEKARAEVFIRERIAEDAARGWFDAQEDKTQAYLTLTDPDFKFTLNMHGSAPISSIVDRIIGVESAGDPTAKNPRSSAEGPGQFIDKTWLSMMQRYRPDLVSGRSRTEILRLKRDSSLSREMTERYAEENAHYLRSNGISDAPGNVYLAHFLGPEGARKVLASPQSAPIEAILPAGVIQANPFLRGKTAAGVSAWSNKKMQGVQRTPDTQTSMPLRDVLGAKAFERLEADLRQRITVANTEADRLAKAEQAQIEQAQQAAETEVTARIYAAGRTDPMTGETIEPITETEIWALADEGIISQSKAQTFIKAISAERPQRSNEVALRELTLAMYAGENIQEDVVEAVGNGLITLNDAEELFSKNRTMNVMGDGSFSKAEHNGLRDLEKLTEPALLPGLKPLQYEQMQRRSFDAKVEYKRRVEARAETGETIDEIVRDVADRALTGGLRDTRNDLSNLVLPRFYVMDPKPNNQRRINPEATRLRILDAQDNGQISEREAIEQEKLIKQWEDLQQLEDMKAAQTNAVGGKN